MITIDSNDKLIGADLRRVYERLGDYSEVLAGIGMEMEARINERFETRTDPRGKPWAVWADSTRKHYPTDGNRKLLDRYGDMLNSINWQADKTSVQIGFGVPYAAYHEWGTKHMPRRGMLFDNPDAGTLSDSDQQAVLDIINDFLESL